MLKNEEGNADWHSWKSGISAAWLQPRSTNTPEWSPVGMRLKVKGAVCFHTCGAEPCKDRIGSLSKYQPAATAAALMRPTWELTNVHPAQVGAWSSAGERAAVRCDGDGWTVSCDSDELLLLFRCQIWRSTIWSSSICRVVLSALVWIWFAHWAKSSKTKKKQKLQSKKKILSLFLIDIDIFCVFGC